MGSFACELGDVVCDYGLRNVEPCQDAHLKEPDLVFFVLQASDSASTHLVKQSTATIMYFS